MYLKPPKNPNKVTKVSYSFRIDPELLENFKLYAKANNQKVPEVLTEIITEKTKDKLLTNDYLDSNNFKLSFTGILYLPSLTEIYDNGNYKEFNLFTNRDNKVMYEIQKIPNNLDIWTEKDGYKSNKRGVNHEGLSFILAPELITQPEYLETPEILLCCLVPLYFKISLNTFRQNTISVTNISFDEALRKINETTNKELLDEYTRFTRTVKDIILAYSNRFKNATKNPDGTYTAGGFNYSDKNQLLLDLFNKLIIELNEYSINVNTNVLNYYDTAENRQNQKLKQNILMSDNPVFLNDQIDLLNDELAEKELENDLLRLENKEIKDKLDYIQNELNNLYTAMEKSIKEAENPEARAETWKNFHE